VMTPSTMAVTAISQRNFSAGILWTMNAAMGDGRKTLIDDACSSARVRNTLAHCGLESNCEMTVVEIPASAFDSEVRVTKSPAS
jgi:hypothetical protein